MKRLRDWLAIWIVVYIATSISASAVLRLCLHVAKLYYEKNPEELEAVEIE